MIPSFHHWAGQDPSSVTRPWLILGKGPSFSRREGFDLSGFGTVALNHAVRELPVDVFHAIYIEVVEHCADVLEQNAALVVMPCIPHVRLNPTAFRKRVEFRPGKLTLEDYCARIPVLKQMAAAGRVLWYNLSTAPRNCVRPEAPVTRAVAFSSTAVLNLLAQVGVRTVRSLGVDGGRDYSGTFADLKDKTLLLSGTRTYDAQFKEIARTIMTTGIDFAPLDIESPIKVYVGTQPEQMLAFKVLEHSIKKHASMSVDVIPLYQAVEASGIEIPEPKDPKLRPRTPFSYQRFAIPALKGYQGRAIYVDSDMQVFKDIREIWTWPFDGAGVLSVMEPDESGRRPQFSVMVLNCEQLRWDAKQLVQDLESGRWTYEQFVYEMAPAGKISASLPEGWNDLERYAESRTGLLHYTDMGIQPWLSTDNPLARIWCQGLFDAMADGYIDRAMVDDHIRRGWVRPSLAYQIDHAIVDPILLPEWVKRDDRRTFVPPHVRGGYGRPFGLTKRAVRRAIARARQFWVDSGAGSIVSKFRARLRHR